MPETFEGGCRCGAVRYVCAAAPAQVAHCHCRECQYASGGAFATVVVVAVAALTVSGELRGYDDRGASGSRVTRKFCPRCGTPVLSVIEANPALCALKAASLDDPSWLQPVAHIWMEDAQPWGLPEPSLPRHARMPGGGGGGGDGRAAKVSP